MQQDSVLMFYLIYLFFFFFLENKLLTFSVFAPNKTYGVAVSSSLFLLYNKNPPINTENQWVIIIIIIIMILHVFKCFQLDGMRPDSAGSIRLGKSPQKTFMKGRPIQKKILEGDWTNLLSITIKMDQSGLSLPGEPVDNSSRPPIGWRGNIRCASLLVMSRRF